MMPVAIENLRRFSLPPEAAQILKEIFNNYKRVVIQDEFSSGLGGNRVILVRPIRTDGTAELLTVVKLAAVGLLEKEWQAYQACIHDRLPNTARAQGPPVTLPGSVWSGLCYPLLGGGGTFKADSLHDYVRRPGVTAADTRFVLERLLKIIKPILQFHRPRPEFRLRASYDPILPVNLLIEPASLPPEVEPRLVTPDLLPTPPLHPGDPIRLTGFVITKVDLLHHSLTLNLPHWFSSSPNSYTLRLKPIEAGSYRLNKIIDPIEGIVTKARAEWLQDEVRRLLGVAAAVPNQALTWPDGPSLPNPLAVWPDLLRQFRHVRVACIHGDLNLENVLVDRETREVNLIDFSEAREDHVLHDFLRLETEVMTKLMPEILHRHDLPPVPSLAAFYWQLHRAVFQAAPIRPPHPDLEKPWAMLTTIRRAARRYFFDADDPGEYYQGLALYLLGALKFKNLDDLPESPLPKQIAFWGAALAFQCLTALLDDPHAPPPIPIPAIDRGVRADTEVIGAELTSPEPWPQLLQPGQPAHFFICYKQSGDADQKLATYLYEFLTAHGHDVFIDGALRTGETWLEEIDRQIKASDFLVVLLSKESAGSEMVRAEVRRAYEYQKSQGHPQILPVRINYEGLLPYSIDAFLDSLQYVIWQSDADNERVGYDILAAAVEGQLPEQLPIPAKPVVGEVAISEDGRIITDDEALHPPLPEFDPRFLQELEAPGGAVKLRDKLYVERKADALLKREIVKSGTTTTIRASRQTGKSSLLVRGMHHARRTGAQVLNLDLQGVDTDYLETADTFLRYLAESIVRKLRLDVAEVEREWRRSLGPQDKLTYLLESYILPEVDAPIVLALDEVDRLLHTPFHNDFFALVRSWHNKRAFDELWDKLNIVMVISTEPHLLIPDVSQSPFNVGLKLYLEDFDEAQVRYLNGQHGSPVRGADLPWLMVMLSGHPYLTRRALYALVAEDSLTWAELTGAIATDQGPLGDHLRHHHWLLRNEPDLQEALRQVIHHNRCSDEMALFRLSRAGLIKGRGELYVCRCDLYRIYFEDKL